MTNGSSASNLVSATRVSTDGRLSWDIRFGSTNFSAAVFPGSGYRAVTNTAPDGSFTISTNLNGQLLSLTAKDSGGSQIGKTSYIYDTHGRQAIATDARTGSTTYGHNNADQVTSTTTPPPGTGQSAQTTAYTIDTMGRTTTTSLPDG